MQLSRISDSDLHDLAASFGGLHPEEELFAKMKKIKDVCEAQQATMRYFEE
jgi:hypothetical protein